MKHFLSSILILLSSLSLFGKSTTVIELTDGTKEIYVVRDYVEYFEDVGSNKEAREIFEKAHFKRVDQDVDDFTNTNTSHAYWIRFSIVNHSSGNQFRLEMFDHDIDEVSLFYIRNDTMVESSSGYSTKFENRDFYHKNIGFFLSLPAKDTITYLMRFRSDKINVLEPVIRSLDTFYRYSLIEYTLLGFFYGLTCIIILYNLVYFISLRKTQYLYYLVYMFSITIFLMSRNGTGFQFLWPDYPAVNYFIEILSSSIGVCFLLLFTNTHLDRSNKTFCVLLVALVIINLCLIPFEILYQLKLVNIILTILFVQVAFVVSLLSYIKDPNRSKWFLLGFIILNVGFVVSWLEYLHIIPSSIYTVYSLYLAINLQFIFISVGLAQGIRKLNQEKNRALTELLEITDKNQMMRILALKKQMSPHFIFNALNSILQRILSGNKEDASSYLVKFSRLIRKTLEQSDNLYSTLADELESLRLYLSIEAMRLGNTFTYSIEVAPNINMDRELIPSFIVQPFVENSIWHGLMPKTGVKNLWVKVEKTDSILTITIEDNGIGRQRSAKNGKQHGSKSHGIGLITERMGLLNKKHQIESSIEVQDLYGSENVPTGTKVIIKTNLQYEQLHQNRNS